ncbi:hypothetical protein B0H11DRAFT_2039968 [Mycena galericulata]|nr:hypothetical protein B0H11DRAFT_2039968 [Mycena galericulata]
MSSNKSRFKAENVLQNATVAAGALRNMSESSQVPFLSSVSAISFAILSVVQSVKVNKDQCMLMIEQIHELLWSIVDVCVNLKTGDFLPPSTLNNIGHFARTLQKILSFVEDMVKMGTLKRFFRQGENAQQLKECKEGLQHALHVFAVQHAVGATAALAGFRIDDSARHEHLLQLIAAQASQVFSDNVSSVCIFFGDLVKRSLSLSLLPPTPKIFHGRDYELKYLVDMFLREPARAAILGTGGMGKTSLATAVIHHTDIAAKYNRRYFIACDSATTHSDLLSLVASHLELDATRNAVKTIIRSLSAGPPTLIVLDNLETPWEPRTFRLDIEEFLALLTDIPHLALLVTLRGAERPAKVRWTRPFLPALTPLSYDAALQTFSDIADDNHDETDIRELLRLTDHLPLAVSLIANAVSFEGSDTVLRRWKNESTTLLSEGQDKRSNLDISIMLSLSSPRMRSVPGAQELLGVVSLLPDGIYDSELIQTALPIRDIQKCKAALIRTSLAYVDRDERLKVLVPIREYVRSAHPPPPSLVRPMRKYLYDILMLWKSYRQISAPDCIPRISANLGNFNSVLDWSLRFDVEDLSETIRSVLTVDSFSRAIGRGVSGLMQRVADLVEGCGDHQLKGEYMTTVLESYEYKIVADPARLEVKAIEEFALANDPVGEVQLYNVLGSYYLIHTEDSAKATTYFNRALTLSVEIGDANGQTKALMHLSEVEWNKGNYRLGQNYSQQAQEATKPGGHLLAEAHAIHTEILCLSSLGDFKRSVEQCTRARKLLTLCGMRGGTLDISIMNSEGDIHFFKSEFQESRFFHTQILEKTSKDQSPIEYAYAQLNIAFVDSAIGAPEETVNQSLDAARAMFTSLGSRGGVTFCDLVVADLQLRRGFKDEPRQFYEKCLVTYRFRVDMAILCLEKLSDPVYDLSDISTTFAFALVLFGFGKKTQNLVAIHNSLRCLGDIYSVQGDQDTAVSLFTLALEGFTAMGIHRNRADCMVRLGDYARQNGDFSKAETLWTEARPLYEKSSQLDSVCSVDERLNSLQIH